MDPKDFVVTEWESVKASKTFKAIVAAECGAVLLFVEGVLEGTQGLSLQDLRGWLLLQLAMVVLIFLRHTLAGIERKLEIMFGGAFIEGLKKRFRDDAIRLLETKGHDEAAKALALAYAAPDPEKVQPDGGSVKGG